MVVSTLFHSKQIILAVIFQFHPNTKLYGDRICNKCKERKGLFGLRGWKIGNSQENISSQKREVTSDSSESIVVSQINKKRNGGKEKRT